MLTDLQGRPWRGLPMIRMSDMASLVMGMYGLIFFMLSLALSKKEIEFFDLYQGRVHSSAALTPEELLQEMAELKPRLGLSLREGFRALATHSTDQELEKHRTRVIVLIYAVVVWLVLGLPTMIFATALWG